MRKDNCGKYPNLILTKLSKVHVWKTASGKQHWQREFRKLLQSKLLEVEPESPLVYLFKVENSEKRKTFKSTLWSLWPLILLILNVCLFLFFYEWLHILFVTKWGYESVFWVGNPFIVAVKPQGYAQWLLNVNLNVLYWFKKKTPQGAFNLEVHPIPLFFKVSSYILWALKAA